MAIVYSGLFHIIYIYSIIRDAMYNYIVNNLTKFYEYCYIENNIYYIDIAVNNKIKKFVLDDYVDNIKNDKN